MLHFITFVEAGTLTGFILFEWKNASSVSLSSYLTARAAAIETLSTALKMPHFIRLREKNNQPTPPADLTLLGIDIVEP